MVSKIDNAADVIDMRDVIARFEELEAELLAQHAGTESDNKLDQQFEEVISDRVNYADEDATEYQWLTKLLSDLQSNGGDEQWRGDWYPGSLVRDSYFKTHAQELAEDCGMIPDNAAWPCTCIDWDQAARELRMDYTCCEFDGVTYWYR